MVERYDLSGEELRDIAESLAHVADLAARMDRAPRSSDADMLARKLLDEAIPEYREKMPEGVQAITAIVNIQDIIERCYQAKSRYSRYLKGTG